MLYLFIFFFIVCCFIESIRKSMRIMTRSFQIETNVRFFHDIMMYYKLSALLHCSFYCLVLELIHSYKLYIY